LSEGRISEKSDVEFKDLGRFLAKFHPSSIPEGFEVDDRRLEGEIHPLQFMLDAG
jgi:hypothetical protein